MSNHTTGETTDLFDFATGRWVGVVDKQGRETLVPTVETNPLTGERALSIGGTTTSLKTLAGPVVAYLGDSIFGSTDTGVGGATPRQLNYSIQSWVRLLSGQRVTTRFSDNYAVPGYTTSDVISSGKLSSAVSALPSFCVVLVGTNDIAGSVPLATIKSNLATIYSSLLAANITVIACPILPRSYWAAGGTLPVAQQQQIAHINQFIKSYALTNRGMYIADAWPSLADMSNGLVLGGGVAGSPPASTGYTYDGLHPAPRAAYWFGKVVSDVITSLLPAQNTLRWSLNDTYDATNNPTGDVLTNGFLSTASGGTAGTGVTGTVAGSWTAVRQTGTTGAATASVVTKALPNGQTYNAQRLVITAPSGSATETIHFYQQKFLPAFAGKNVVAEAEVSISGIGAANALKSVYLECSDGATFCADQYPSLAYLMPDVSWSGVLKTQPVVLSAAVQQLSVRVSIDGTVASAGVTIEISRLSFRVID